MKPSHSDPPSQIPKQEAVRTPVSQDAQELSTSPLRFDWGEALDVYAFYGREQELAWLSHWVVQEHCQLVSVLGMGGIGKSALAVTLMRQVAPAFDAVIFRSVRDAPACQDLLADCLQVLSAQPLSVLPSSVERCIDVLLECLQTQHCLLVLDNLETLLQEQDAAGHLRPEYEDYTTLLCRVAQTPHQSCLLLTSRESPEVLAPLENTQTGVRALRLRGLEPNTCEQLFNERGLIGTVQDQTRLAQQYGGNPLALNIVAETITELFAGEIGSFLEQEVVIFSSIRDLLAAQWTRLSALEQAVVIWLALVREPIAMVQLHALLDAPMAPSVLEQLPAALQALHRRSLVEQGKQLGTFTLQSVVLEYVTEVLVERFSQQIQCGIWQDLISYALSQAQAKDYVRHAQERMLVTPILVRLQALFLQNAACEEWLLGLLDQLRTWDQQAQGYGPTNLIVLLRQLRGHLRGLDLSQLSLRGANLQGVQMQDARLCGATLRDTTLTEAMPAVWSVDISRTGQYWAAGSWRGEVRVWREGGQRLHLAWQAHTDNIFILALSPDEHTLATGSWDRTVKLWDVHSGTLLWTGWHTDIVFCVAFSPDGQTLASSGNDGIIQLWDVSSGKQLQRRESQGGTVYTMAWSPDARRLACGCADGSIELWSLQTEQAATRVLKVVAHTNWVLSLAFSPDGTQLVSGSWDSTVKLWEVENLRVLQTLTGHTQRISFVAWSPDGRTVASASFDQTVRVWDVTQQRSRLVLHGHTAAVYHLAFTPDSCCLLSSSEDHTMRLWDVTTGVCLRTLEGYAVSLYDLDWSPDGIHLVSGSADGLVIVWEVTGKRPPRVLGGHQWIVWGVGWSPDGQWLASAGWDNTIRLWEPTTGACRQILRDPDHEDTLFHCVTWSPDGCLLACGTYLRGVFQWDIRTQHRRWIGQTQPTAVRCVVWSPDGKWLASGSDDGKIGLWESTTGTLLQNLSGHHGGISSLAWSPDGRRLSSASGGRNGGELVVWEVQSGTCLQTFAGQPALVSAVTWDQSGDLLVSGGSDGRLCWWEVQSGRCLRVEEAHEGTILSLKRSPDGRHLASGGDDGAIRIWEAHSGECVQTLRRDRPYERLNITNIHGLTEAQKANLRALGAFEEMAGNGP
jgi:WD40 repeat protein